MSKQAHQLRRKHNNYYEPNWHFLKTHLHLVYINLSLWVLPWSSKTWSCLFTFNDQTREILDWIWSVQHAGIHWPIHIYNKPGYNIFHGMVWLGLFLVHLRLKLAVTYIAFPRKNSTSCMSNSIVRADAGASDKHACSAERWWIRKNGFGEKEWWLLIILYPAHRLQ